MDDLISRKHKTGGRAMTRQEAVKWLSNLKMDIGKTQHQELWHYEQALDEIIQTLEQEPSCRNTRQVDLISREEK